MKPKFITLLLCILCLSSFSVLKAQDNLKSDLYLYYATGEYKLDKQLETQIDSFLKLTNKPLFFTVDISAYTDSDGTVQSNVVLARQRAETLKKYLETAHIDPAKIKAASFGETSPAHVNDDQNKWKNRCVKMSITQTDFFGSMKTEKQVFRIDPGIYSVIKGKGGTRVIIAPNTLVRKSGAQVFGMVDVELTEFYKKSDFVLNDLPFNSGEKLLESGGTICIQAFSNGQELNVKEGKTLKIRMPAMELKDDMQAFYGTVNDSTQAVSDWNIDATLGSLINQSRRVDFAGAEKLLMRTFGDRYRSQSPLAERELLEFFGEPGNEEELGILIGNAVKKRSSAQLQSLVDQYDIDMIKPGKEFKGTGNAQPDFIGGEGKGYSFYSVVYKRKSRRDVNLQEETFKNMDLENIDVIEYVKNDVEYKVELTRAKLSFDEPYTVNDYLIETNALNWINCDRFLREASILINVSASFDTAVYNNLHAYLVFKDINSIMAGTLYADGHMVFNNIPRGKEAWLVAYTISDGELKLFKKEITAGTVREEVKLEKADEGQFKESLAALDK